MIKFNFLNFISCQNEKLQRFLNLSINLIKVISTFINLLILNVIKIAFLIFQNEIFKYFEKIKKKLVITKVYYNNFSLIDVF